MEPRCAVEVLEAVQAEVAEPFPVEERSRRRREDDLAAVCKRGDACSAVDVDPDVSLGRHGRRARVEAHANPERAEVERRLSVDRCGRRARCGGKGDEEGVALRVDLDPAVRGERGAESAPVLRQRLGVRLGPERVQQPRRALDVREEEGDRAARELGAHRGSR